MRKILLLLLLIGFMGNNIKAGHRQGYPCTYNTDCNWANVCNADKVCERWGGIVYHTEGW